jgi:hypothetical protein
MLEMNRENYWFNFTMVRCSLFVLCTTFSAILARAAISAARDHEGKMAADVPEMNH